MSSTYKLKNGTWGILYNIKIADGNWKKARKSGFNTKADAILWQLKASKDNNHINYTLKEFCEYFLNVKKNNGCASATIKDYSYYINKILEKIPGYIKMQAITSKLLQETLDSFLPQRSNYDHAKRLLSNMFKIAYKREIILANPYERIETLGVKKSNTIYYPLEVFPVLLQLIKEHKPEYYAATVATGVLGLRPSEALALSIKHVSQDYLLVENTIDCHTNELKHRTKTEDSHRNIPLTQEIKIELLHYYNNSIANSEYLSHNANGAYHTLNAYATMLEKLTTKFNLPKATPRMFRHTFGNNCKRIGIDEFTTSKLMGHSDPATTKKFYFKNDDTLNKLAMNKISTNMFK